jgi:hypothetical protein
LGTAISTGLPSVNASQMMTISGSDGVYATKTPIVLRRRAGLKFGTTTETRLGIQAEHRCVAGHV